MRLNSLLFKKTSDYQTFINVQNRAPAFFIDQLSRLGLTANMQNVSKDLDSSKYTRVLASLDVRVLSKAKLDFFLNTLNSYKFRKAGLVKASILSSSSLKGKLTYNTRGLAGFDGSPLVILVYSSFRAALHPFPDLSREDFLDDESTKEWSVLSQACSPSLVSFEGYLFPFEFFEEKFKKVADSSVNPSNYLLHELSLTVARVFGLSFFKLTEVGSSAVGKPLVAVASSSFILSVIFLSFINQRLCQQ